MVATAPAPFYREAGSGPGVVCLHSNASTSSQWVPLMEQLADRRHVLAVDSFGAGRSPDWPTHDEVGLAEEAALIEPVLARAGTPFVLVGHSYGAAVALLAALAQPGRVRALVLYEPTLFSLVDAERAPPNEADGIKAAVEAAARALDEGDEDRAAGHFIDYWMGAGSWRATPDKRKPAISASVRHVRRWARALLAEPTPLAAFRTLEMPVLYMVGKRSTASALAVARLLCETLPNVQRMEFDDAGHMGPMTHAAAVNAAIEGFLDRLPQ